jgi:hypothetical protein
LPGPILLSTTIPFSGLNNTACVLAFPLLRTPPLGDRTSVRLPTRWLAFDRVGFAGLRPFTHWVTLTCFKRCLLYSRVPDLARHDNPLVAGPRRVWRVCRAFVPAFVAYAVAWYVRWFAYGAGLGEWLASLVGSLAFMAVFSWGPASWRCFASTSMVFFVTHSAGYFAGGWCMAWVLQSHRSGVLAGVSKDLVGIVAKLAWGLAYGVGFGAGLGYALHACQRRSMKPTTGS